MTQYSYQLQKKKYGDYRDLLQELADLNPGQMSFEEYCYMYDIISKRRGSNFLVFGLGKDSDMWIKCNANGKTVFLEHDTAWISPAKEQIPDIDIREVQYGTENGHDATKLLNEYKEGQNNLSLEL